LDSIRTTRVITGGHRGICHKPLRVGLIDGAASGAGYAAYHFWFHFANSSFMPAAIMGLVSGAVAAGVGSDAVGSVGGAWIAPGTLSRLA
jgi:hypothetical protein